MRKILLLLWLVAGIACKKAVTLAPEPVIVIGTPSAAQHFMKGDTIHINGNVTHTIEMMEVAVHMTDLSSKSEFFHNHFSAGNKTYYEFDSKYPVTETVKTSFKVEVEATDKDGNAATKEITITIN